MFDTNFSTLDWSILAIYLAGTVVLGVFVNRYVFHLSDYLVGGRASGTFLNIATYIGTGLGLVTIMYASMDGFARGFAYLSLAVIAMLVSFAVGRTGFVISRLRELDLLTIPEYYERRFDKRTRVTAGVICAAAGILNMGLFPKMGAIFLTYASGLGTHGNDNETLINVITSALILLVLLYTVMGGMVAVIATDFVQFLVLSLGMGVGLYYCFSTPHLGFDAIMEVQAQYRGEGAFNPFHGDSYGWIYMIWMLLTFLLASICWAPEASRALTCKDPRTARSTFLLSSPGMFARLAIPALWGIAAYAFFMQDAGLSAYFLPDGSGGETVNNAHAMPLLLGKVVPTGLLGVLIAALMAAFMSTHDSYLLCWSSVISNDVIAPLRKTPPGDREKIKITRVSVVLIGLFLLIWGIWYELPESVWAYMAVTGSIYLSGSGTVLIGGVYWRRASSTGAFVALLSGLVAVGGLFVDPIQRVVPWIDAALIGLGSYVFCAVVFVVVSLLFPDKPRVSP